VTAPRAHRPSRAPAFRAARDHLPQSNPRHGRRSRFRLLGLVVNLRYPENLEVIAEARRRGAVSGCAVLIADANEFVDRRKSYENLLRERRMDGLLMGTLMPTTDAIAEIARQNLPLVLVNRRIPGLAPGVSFDDQAALYVAVSHLVELGHTRIAYVTGPGESDTVHRRETAFRRAIADAGLHLPAGYVAVSSSDPLAGPARALRHLLSLDRRPTAVVLWTVGDAAGALHGVRERGLVPPRDVSLVAINDAPFASYLIPAMTVVRMPLAEVTGRAVARLFDVVQGRPTRGDVFIRTPPELVQRASTVPPPEAT
jgi:LacI family transcriptional regulator